MEPSGPVTLYYRLHAFHRWLRMGLEAGNDSGEFWAEGLLALDRYLSLTSTGSSQAMRRRTGILKPIHKTGWGGGEVCCGRVEEGEAERLTSAWNRLKRHYALFICSKEFHEVSNAGMAGSNQLY